MTLTSLKPPLTATAGLNSGNVVVNASSASPVNTEKLYISVTGTEPLEDLDVSLTTPESTQHLVSRYDDLDRLVSPNPGVYNWGIFSYEVNSGTAPVTAIGGRGRGNTVYTVSSSGRAYGVDPQIHGVEITAGTFPTIATATTTNGSATLTNIVLAQDSHGGRFEATMPITGTNIPGGTTISSITGRAGAPTTIVMSAVATGTGSVTITGEPVGTQEVIGLLVTGNNGTSATAVSSSSAVQFQAQNTISRWAYGINVGDSLQATGKAIRHASSTAARTISIESMTLTEAIAVASTSLTNVMLVSSVTASGSLISFSGNTATTGINFASSGVFSSGAAITLSAQNIATDQTTGMKIGTSALQKIGKWGVTPAAQPTGWGTPTGTLTRTTFATGSVTLPQLAEHVAALISDLKTSGDLGA